MKYINSNSMINLEWQVMKGVGNVEEDFSRSDVYLYLRNNDDKWFVAVESKDNGLVKATLPEGLDEGVYGFELRWFKNDKRSIMSSSKLCVFGITEVEDAADATDAGTVTIRIKTTASSYGYDGLGSFEVACMLGLIDDGTSRSEWVEGVVEVNQYLQNKFTGIDTALANRYTKSEVYSKTEVNNKDTLLNNAIVNLQSSHNTDVDRIDETLEALALTRATKQEMNNALAGKASTLAVTNAQATADNAITAVNNEASARAAAISALRSEMEEVHNILDADIATRATTTALEALVARVAVLEAKHTSSGGVGGNTSGGTVESGGEFGGGSIQQPVG